MGKKKKKNPEWEATKADVRRLAIVAMENQPHSDLGWGYLWGYIDEVKTLIVSIDGRAGHSEILAVVKDHPAVSSAWINLD